VERILTRSPARERVDIDALRFRPKTIDERDL
jgi:hypothetical protein